MTTTILHYTLTALAPLVFSERRPDGQFRPSAPFVSGSALRGALAHQLQMEGATGGDFAALFTAADAPLFRNAYPASGLLPSTAQTCKANPGFAPKAHGVSDSLLDRLCWETQDAQTPMPFAYMPHCRVCGGRMEGYSGFYDTQNKTHVTPPRQLTTRVGVNRRRQVAEDGLLYSPLVIAEGLLNEKTKDYAETTFRGSVVVFNAGQEVLVRQCLGGLTHVGSGASRGFGHVTVKFDDLPPDTEGGMSSRIDNFNARFKERWEAWRVAVHDRKDALPGGEYFSVLLLSEAVLRADGWTPTVRLEPSLLGPEFAGVTLERCYAGVESRGGWNTAWGLPKDTELMAARGSVYVYRAPAIDKSALSALEVQGVGARSAEGFGQVRICDGFHVREGQT